MTDPAPSRDVSQTAQSEARDAIDAFTEILDVFPNDIGTLDALAQSYHLLGDTKQELHYLKRLFRVLLEQGDTDAVGDHAARLKPLTREDPEASELYAQLHALGISEKDAVPPISAPFPSEKKSGAVVLADRSTITDAEMTLAWSLKEAGVLHEEEYAGVVQDLTDISGQNPLLTVSVLHVLQDRTSRNLDAAMAFIVKESRKPSAPLEHLEPDEDTLLLIPTDVMTAQGVAVFDHIGSELLVAAMNPLREGLRKQLESYTDRPCHLFAVHPAAFDGWITRVQETLKAKQDAETG